MGRGSVAFARSCVSVQLPGHERESHREPRSLGQHHRPISHESNQVGDRRGLGNRDISGALLEFFNRGHAGLLGRCVQRCREGQF